MEQVKEKLKSNVQQIKIICDHLIKECEHDDNLAKRILLDNKNVNSMYQYILKTVKSKYKIVQGGVFVPPEEVYSMAIHYFLEDEEELNKELPKEDVKEKYQVEEEPKKEVATKPKQDKAPKEKPQKEEQINLFDLLGDDE